jgi:hypothetical protein
MKKTLLFTAILGFLLAGSAYGQFYLGLDGGVSSQKLSLEDVDFDKDTSFVYGLRLGFNFLFLAVEGQYFQVSHNMMLSDFPDINWGDRSVNYNYLGLNGKLFLPIPIVRPYFILGFGYYTTNVKDIGKDSVTDVNFGIGVEFKLGQSFGILGEGKYHSGIFGIDESDLAVKNYTLTGGFNFYF